MQNNYQYPAITLTFGEQAENHTGMQVLGNGLAPKGFTRKELQEAARKFMEGGWTVEYVRLDKPMRDEVDVKLDRAAVLIVRDGAYELAGDADYLFAEQMGLDWDTQALMRGRVVNKRARYNLCYGDEDQKADFEAGRGTIVSWDRIPYTKTVRDKLPFFLGEKARNCQGEGNLYYDARQCGIGPHGDTERRLVMAVRLGEEMPLSFQWFHRHRPIGHRIDLTLRHGDFYVMSDKATGHDWKKSSIATLRHAAGCKKYIDAFDKKK